ncbi:hypothetical protein [Dyadobacter tibetensis]|uniref:hypothetical protein n=1 Tax=Dyadobacter tibetensis TaxID=1211851 RepID=UPI00046EAB74|nr:hypothetical protein [Dyadobacter tibetensis]
MKKIILWGLIAGILGPLWGCSRSDKMTAITTIDSEFENSLDDWTPFLANYPIDSDTALISYRIASAPLPSPLDTNSYGLYLKSRNLGEGMTMLIKKRVGGLSPDTEYNLEVDLSLATNYYESVDSLAKTAARLVYIKAGVSSIEPDTIRQSGYFRMNIPWNNPASETSMHKVIGDLNNKAVSGTYTLFQHSLTSGLNFTSDATGDAWLVLAIDSNFSGEASLYLDRIVVKLRRSIE